jgi:hypothetical protein
MKLISTLGRPPTGTAKGAAQLQREYRARQKALRAAGSRSVVLTPKDRFVLVECLSATCQLDGNDYVNALIEKLTDSPRHKSHLITD